MNKFFSKWIFLCLFSLVPSLVMAQGTIIGGFDVGPGGDPQSKLGHGGAGHNWHSKIFAPMVNMTSDYSKHTSEGALSLSWTPNNDFTEWTFILRDKVKWHDGKPFTANDVKFTIEFLFAPGASFTYPGLAKEAKNLKGIGPYQEGKVKEIVGINVISKNIIKFHLEKSSPRFYDDFRLLYPLPKHAIKFAPKNAATTKWWLTSPVGTGPYKFSRYRKDQYMELVPNPYYWDGKSKLKKLINRYFADETAAVLALRSGDIDFTYVSSDVAAQFQGNSDFEVFSGPSYVTNVFNFNYKRKPWNDVRVRQALMYGIDRESIIRDVFNGTAKATPCQDPYPTFWPKDANMYEYNPSKARRLLIQAQQDGISLRGQQFPIPTYYNSQLAKDILTVVQANLAEVGINSVPEFLDVASWRVKVDKNSDFDFTYRGVGGGPAQFYSPWYEKGNQWGLKDGNFLTLLDKMDSAATWDKYVAARTEMCKYQNDNATFAYWWVSTRYGVARKGLKNFYYTPAPGGGPYVDSSHTWSK